ncbi:CCR4-NOT core subunit cdc39 [Microbotryomycetes sp. JL221]|nr:CCR4-NOT core subunit cdc39 [Microbotryomycetes sp. JL221]
MAFRTFASSVLGDAKSRLHTQPVFYSTRDSYVPFDAEDDILGASADSHDAHEQRRTARALSFDGGGSDDEDGRRSDDSNMQVKSVARTAFDMGTARDSFLSASTAYFSKLKQRGWRAHETHVFAHDDQDDDDGDETFSDDEPQEAFLSKPASRGTTTLTQPLLGSTIGANPYSSSVAPHVVRNGGMHDIAWLGLFVISLALVIVNTLRQWWTLPAYPALSSNLTAVITSTALVTVFIAVVAGFALSTYLQVARSAARVLVPVIALASPLLLVLSGMVALTSSFVQKDASWAFTLILRVFGLLVWMSAALVLRSVWRKRALLAKVVALCDATTVARQFFGTSERGPEHSAQASWLIQASSLVRFTFGVLTSGAGIAVGTFALLPLGRVGVSDARTLSLVTTLCLATPVWMLRLTQAVFCDTIDALVVCIMLEDEDESSQARTELSRSAAAIANSQQSSPQPKNDQTDAGANSSLLTIVRAQIVFLVSTLSDDNFNKNRDELRSLVDLHGPASQQHLVRRLLVAASSALQSPSASSHSAAASQPTPPIHLVSRLLTIELQRLSRDPAVAERLRDAVIEPVSDGQDAILSHFRLSQVLAQPALNDISPLEQVLLAAPFVTLLSASSSAGSNSNQQAIAFDALKVVHTAFPGALDRLGQPPTSSGDVPELSPLSISRLFVLLLSDRSVSNERGAAENSSLSIADKHALVLAAVRGRLGLDVGAQALAHAVADPAFIMSPSTSPAAMLVQLCPAQDLCSSELVRAVLDRSGTLQQPGNGEAESRVTATITEIIEMADRSTNGPLGINMRSFVNAVHAIQPSLRWAEVVRGFDHLNVALPGVAGTQMLAQVLSSSPSAKDAGANGVGAHAASDASSAAVSGLWNPWRNKLQQVGLLDRLLYLPPDIFTFADVPAVKRAISLENISNASSLIKTAASSVLDSSWNCIDLVLTLVKIGEAPGGDEAAARAHEVLDRGCKTNPELVFVSLVQSDVGPTPAAATFTLAVAYHNLAFAQKPWSILHSELVTRLLSAFLNGHPAHQLALLRLWQINSTMLASAFRDFWTESEMNISRIVDVAQELKLLDVVLELQPTFLALDAAALAGRREFLNLEKWLTNALAAHGEPFVRTVLEFLSHKARHDLQRQEFEPSPPPTTLSLSAQTVALFIRSLRMQHELFSSGDVELFKEVRTLCLQLHPRLMNFAPGNTDNEPGMAVVSFSSDIETECDALYRRMYDKEVSVEEVVTALKRAQESDNKHDHEFFACFLHGLFDEHRFFNTYPSNELSLTAALFGDLIQYQLIDFVPLGIAVRYVLDALRNGPDSNWFRFGVQALERFQSRLVEWPQLAQSILAIPHVQDRHPELAAAARTALQQRENDVDAPADTLDLVPGPDFLHKPPGANVVEAERPIFTAINVDRDGEGDPQPPDEDTSDKILFIVNNLAPSNFDAKVMEMMDRIDSAHFAWFAHYLVARRVSIEPNNHGLYQRFLDALAMPSLINRVLHETYVKLATLLNSEKTVQSSTERTLLKNLGSWLGGLTLARDRPIKQQNIAFKELLIQGYDSNRLIVAIPFVCKVLEQSAKSRVFKPPNPWLMAILRLLVELYQFAELKLNLKFEIEVLCKSLNLELKDVEPTNTLRTRPKDLAPTATPAASLMPREMDEQAFARTFSATAGQVPSLSGLGEPSRGPPPALMLGSNQAGYSLSLQDSIASALQPLPDQLVFSIQIPVFSGNATLKRLVFVAFDRAIRDIIAPVVERSVTIAGISTRELTMKDFAMEGDESKMAQAAHLMVQNLAGSLALVTCKEPLRISIVTHIRNLLLQNGFTEQTMPEQAILTVAADNLDFACAVVEKVAMEKAMLEVDDGLSPAYLTRRTHREASLVSEFSKTSHRSREAFWDTAAMAASHYSGMLPDPLRLKLGGLQPQQLQVYEDFARVRSVQLPPDGRGGALFAAESPSLAPAQIATDEEGTDPGTLPGAQAMERFAVLISDLEKLVASEPQPSLALIAPDSPLRQVMEQILEVASKSAARDETALASSQKVVQLLYRSDSTLAREVFVLLLEQLCALSSKVAREVMAWLVYAEDERKFNVPVTIALVQARLINVGELEAQLAKFVLRDYKPSVIDFVSGFVTDCLTSSAPIVSPDQLANCIDALAQANRAGKGTEASKQALIKVRGSSSRSSSPARADDSDMRQQLIFSFAEWVRLYQQSASVEKSFVEFVVSLQNQGILKGEEISSLFFRVCTEVSVDSYIKHKAAGGSPSTGIFQPVDAFAKLIVFMIKYHADPTGANNDKAKVHYMTKVLSIVVLVLANSHEELGPHFQQKPFYRFFSSLLSNLHAIEGHLGSAYHQILVALSHSLNTLQPMFFPGFTFSWVSLVSHRLFMPKLLATKDKEASSTFTVTDSECELGSTTRALYLGTERILLVLLHDFPDFLAQAAFAICDVVPAQCVQLHNLVLSAFPISTAMRLPDPLQAGLQLESLPESQKSPQILADFTAALTAVNSRAVVDKFLQSRASMPSIVQNLEQHLKCKDEASTGAALMINVPFINSLVLYLGVAAISQSKAASGSVRLDPKSAWWFSELLLTTFADVDHEGVRESIVRVLLERVVAQRPHAWGVLHTFNQLLDERFGLLKYKFVQSTPEVAHLLTQVSTRARTLTAAAATAAAAA